MHIHGNKMPASIKLCPIYRYNVNSSLHKEKIFPSYIFQNICLLIRSYSTIMQKKHVFFNNYDVLDVPDVSDS